MFKILEQLPYPYSSINYILAFENIVDPDQHILEPTLFVMQPVIALTLCLLVSSADNLCKLFGPISGPTKMSGLIWVLTV